MLQMELAFPIERNCAWSLNGFTAGRIGAERTVHFMVVIRAIRIVRVHVERLVWEWFLIRWGNDRVSPRRTSASLTKGATYLADGTCEAMFVIFPLQLSVAA
jgi:hypothetical protein